MKNQKTEKIKKTLELFKKNKIEVKVMNKDLGHYRTGDFDFWPTTGTVYNYKDKKKYNGMENLINSIKKEKKENGIIARFIKFIKSL